MEIKEYAFNTGAVVLNYTQAGSSGSPLVLLHGGNARWQSFESIIPGLAATWQIYAPDFRGQGKSGWVPGSYRLQDYTDDIIAFLHHHMNESAYLFGYSLGGMVALMVAAQYPAGVRAVAIGDAPLSRQSWYAHLQYGRKRITAWRDLCGGQTSIEQIIDILKDAPTEVPGKSEAVPMREVVGEDHPVYTWYATNLYQSDPDMLTAILDRFEVTAAGYDMDTVLPAIGCPVLLLQADPAAGGIMTDEEIEQAWPRLAQPVHVRLAGESHALHHVHPEPVVAALKTFFESC